jgi:hypothetical protein
MVSTFASARVIAPHPQRVMINHPGISEHRLDASKGGVVDDARGAGRTLFAAVLLLTGGILNVIWGIAAIGSSAFFAADQHYVFASLHGWGWITLILGVIELMAGLSLFAGGAFGRWFGIIAASLAAIGALLDIPAYPFWSLAIFGISLWIIYGLAAYGESGRGAPA